MEDYRLSSANGRFAEAAAFVRAYPTDLPKLPALAERIVTPVLVISGQSDPLVPPSNGDLLQRILPNCRHEVIDCGHFVWEDAPDAYIRFASAWIRTHGLRTDW
jgi:pimeloyl-ACP methyl ester carboxylesterase